MEEGLQFIGSGKPSIMSFGDAPCKEQEPDFYSIESDLVIKVIRRVAKAMRKTA